MSRSIGGAAFALVGLILACRSSTATTEPDSPDADATCPATSRCLIVTGLTGPAHAGIGRAVVIDPDRRIVLGRMGPVIDHPGLSALSSDHTTLLLPGEAHGSGGVAAVDVKSGQTLWWQSIPPAHGAPAGYATPGAVVMSADRNHLYTDDGGGGILEVSVQSDSALQFAPVESFLGHFAMTEGHAVIPSGTLLITGSRERRAVNQVYLLSSSLAFQDSIVAPPGLSVLDAILSPDETLLYALAPPRLVAVDLAARGIVYDAVTPYNGLLWTLSISPGGDHIFLTDAGNLDWSGSGVMVEYSRDLAVRRDIPLQPPDAVDPHVSAWQVAETRDGEWAYVLTGATIGGNGYGPAAVRVVDLAAGQVVAVIPIGEYGLAYRLQLIEP